MILVFLFLVILKSLHCFPYPRPKNWKHKFSPNKWKMKKNPWQWQIWKQSAMWNSCDFLLQEKKGRNTLSSYNSIIALQIRDEKGHVGGNGGCFVSFVQFIFAKKLWVENQRFFFGTKINVRRAEDKQIINSLNLLNFGNENCLKKKLFLFCETWEDHYL